MASGMVKIFADRVHYKKLTLDEVPERWREDVKRYIEENY